MSIPWVPGERVPSSATQAGQSAAQPSVSPSPHQRAFLAGVTAGPGQTGRTAPRHTPHIPKPAQGATDSEGTAATQRDRHSPAAPSSFTCSAREINLGPGRKRGEREGNTGVKGEKGFFLPSVRRLPGLAS